MHLENDKYLQGLPSCLHALAVDTTTAQRCELHDDRTASRMIYELFLAMQVKFERSFTGAGGWLAGMSCETIKFLASCDPIAVLRLSV